MTRQGRGPLVGASAAAPVDVGVCSEGVEIHSKVPMESGARAVPLGGGTAPAAGTAGGGVGVTWEGAAGLYGEARNRQGRIHSATIWWMRSGSAQQPANSIRARPELSLSHYLSYLQDVDSA